MSNQSVKSKIQSLKGLNLSTPEMARRVSSELSAHRDQRSIKFWKLSSIVSVLLLFLTLNFMYFDRGESGVYFADTDSSYVVNVDLVSSDSRDFDVMEIELPKGIRFASDRYPYLDIVNKVALNKESLKGMEQFPIVIRGHERGSKILSINFYDSDHRLIDSEPVKIYFY